MIGITRGLAIAAALSAPVVVGAPPFRDPNLPGKSFSGNVVPGFTGDVAPKFVGSLPAPAKEGPVVDSETKLGQIEEAQQRRLGLGNATDISKATYIPLEDAIHILQDAIHYMEKGESSDKGSEHYSKLVEVVEQYLGDKATQFHSQCPEIIWKISLSCKETLGDFKETLDDLLNRLNEMNKVMSSTSVVSSTTPAVTPRPEVPVNATNSTGFIQAIKNITTVLSTTLAGIMTTPAENDLKDTILKNLSKISEVIQNLTTLYNGSNHTNINYTETFAPFNPHNPHHTNTTDTGTPAPFNPHNPHNPHHTNTTDTGTPVPTKENPLVYSGTNGTRDSMTNVSNNTNSTNVTKSSDSSTSEDVGGAIGGLVGFASLLVSVAYLTKKLIVPRNRIM